MIHLPFTRRFLESLNKKYIYLRQKQTNKQTSNDLLMKGQDL